MDRRVFLKYLSLTAAAALPLVYNACSGGLQSQLNSDDSPSSSGTPDSGEVPYQLPADALNVKSFGAKGDGVTNDTDAFFAASKAIMAAGGGTLYVPAGIYIVGKQHSGLNPDGNYNAFLPSPIIDIYNCSKPVVITGEAGTKMKAADGLRFGSFDPKTGEPYTPPGYFTDFTYQANAYTMINTRGNADVLIQNFELDGNIFNLVLGGPWGDTGRQCSATGFFSGSNKKFKAKNIYTHHHGLDGGMAAHPGITETSPICPIVLENVVSEYNARQGFSWVGGNSFTANNCKFNHTGKARFSSAPGAGFDVEAEDSICRNGAWNNCEFVNNGGCGLVADSGDSANLTLTNCLLWGTNSWAAWPRKPYTKFVGCTIRGCVVNGWFSATDPASSVKFQGCTFDEASATDPVYPRNKESSYSLTFWGACPGLVVDQCTFNLTTFSAWMIYASVPGVPALILNTKVTQGPNWTSMNGVKLDNVQFYEKFSAKPPQNYVMACANVTIGNNVTVQGPYVRLNVPPYVGAIPAGTY